VYNTRNQISYAARYNFLWKRFRRQASRGISRESGCTSARESCANFRAGAEFAGRSIEVLGKDERCPKDLGSAHGICRKYSSPARDDREGKSGHPTAWISKEIAQNSAAGYGNCSAETEAVF